MAKLAFAKYLVKGLNGMAAEYRCKGQETAEHPFMIVADRSGMRFKGESPFITEVEDLQELARTIDLARRSHADFAAGPVEGAPSDL
jgi:hypothetical protein